MEIEYKYKERIKKLLSDDKMSREDTKHQIKKIVYKITNKNLYNIYNKLTNDESDIKISSKNTFVHIVDDNVNLENYRVKNIREVCTW